MANNNNNKQESIPVEILTLASGIERATIATNGDRHVAQIGYNCYEFHRLAGAILFLHDNGFELVVDECKSL